jgi:hypothetical protein
MACEGCKERREKIAAAMRAMQNAFLAKVGIAHPPEPKEIQPPETVDSPKRG